MVISPAKAIATQTVSLAVLDLIIHAAYKPPAEGQRLRPVHQPA